MRTFISFSIAAACFFIALPAHGATMTIRTGMVDTIESITEKDSNASVVRTTGALPIAIYQLEFSVTAHEKDITIPRAVTRGESDASGLEFIIESREGEIIEDGFAVGILLADGEGDDVTVHSGETEHFTLLVAYTNTPDSSREDRMRISGMTLRALTQNAELNPSELEHLHTEYIELVETR